MVVLLAASGCALPLPDAAEPTDKALALRELQSLAEASPDDTTLAFQLGRAYSLNRVPDKAVSQFEQVIGLELEDALGVFEMH